LELSKILAYLIVGAVSLALTYGIGRLKWPRWAYWASSMACVAGLIAMVVTLSLWSANSAWPNAIIVGLAAIAGATAGVAFHGGLGAQLRSDTSLERASEK
jgi:peptidoglycan/LPS O-acetylase OafA/YrhL